MFLRHTSDDDIAMISSWRQGGNSNYATKKSNASIPMKHPSAQLLEFVPKPSKFSMGRAANKKPLLVMNKDENSDWNMQDEYCSGSNFEGCDNVQRFGSTFTLSTNDDEAQSSNSGTSPFDYRRQDLTQINHLA